MKDNNIETDKADFMLDDLFRNSMKNHSTEPSPKVWKKIGRGLFWDDLLHFRFTNLSFRYWAIFAMVTMVAGFSIYFLPTEDESFANEQPVQSGEKRLMKPVVSDPEISATMVGIVTASEQNTISGSLEPDMPIPGEPEPSVHSQPVSTFISSEVPDVRSINVFRMIPVDFQLFGDNIPDSVRIIHTVHGDVKVSESGRKSVPQMWSVALGVLPEKAFYQSEENYSKMNYWLQGGLTWHYSRFSIGTGLELGYMIDQGKYRVDYKSLDSVGYYSSVVSYTVGTNNEIIYNTSVKTLYDSLNHSADPSTTNRYTYLRFPLLIGYRMVETNRFSVTLKAGPAWSVLLAEKKGVPVVEYENATITRIDEETSPRLKTNWQLWANLLLEMKISERFSLYLEPNWKYYLKPTAEQESPNAKAPWSVGVGLGVQVNLDTKK
jgi:hypothetical protein